MGSAGGEPCAPDDGRAGPGRGGSDASPRSAPARRLARPPRGDLQSWPRAPGGRPELDYRAPAQPCPRSPEALPDPARGGPRRRFPGVSGAQRPPQSKMPPAPPSPGPRRSAARHTHRPQPAGRRPHSAPGPRSPNSLPSRSLRRGWAERFVAMSRIIPELPAPAARRPPGSARSAGSRRLCFRCPASSVLGSLR